MTPFAVVLSVIMQGGAIGRLERAPRDKTADRGPCDHDDRFVIAGLAEVPGHAYLAAVFLSVGSAVTNLTCSRRCRALKPRDERAPCSV